MNKDQALELDYMHEIADAVSTAAVVEFAYLVVNLLNGEIEWDDMVDAHNENLEILEGIR